MKNDLREWLVKNRDAEGLAALFYEIDKRMAMKERLVINGVRNERLALKDLGALDELSWLKSFLTEPLTITESGSDT